MHALLLVLPLLSLSVPATYQRVGGTAGVTVYRLMSSPVIDLIAEGDFDAPPSAVQAVVLDYAHARTISRRVAKSLVVDSRPGELLVYQRLSLPVVADRDYGLRVQWGPRGDQLWTRFAIDNSASPEPEPEDEVVRVSTMSGGWDLEPIRDGLGTHAIYHVRIDMAGSIPRWMVSGGAAKDLPKLFEGVRAQLSRRLVASRSINGSDAR